MESKPIVKSLTIQGLIVTLAGTLLAPRLAKWGVTSEQVGEVAEYGAALVGAVMTIVGRLRAGGISGVVTAAK